MIEIHQPELEQRLLAQIQSGRFRDVDEFIEKALEALGAREDSTREPNVTGAGLWAALRNSPLNEINLTRDRESILVRDIDL